MLLARVRRTIRERRLIERHARVLVAVSGGPDSTAMLDVLARLRRELDLDLVAASVNHGLRREADSEIELVGQQADRLGVPFHVLRVTVEPRGSLQAKARTARYAALTELAKQCGAVRIAVGHTKDDQAETVVARLLRGSGPRGLAGIAPKRADGVIRPLIDATRQDVHAWNEGHGLVFANDPSNENRRFQRVRIRHELLPQLAEESPAIIAHLANLADDSRALVSLSRREASRLLRRAIIDDTTLDVGNMRKAPVAARREAIRSWAESISGRTIRRAHLDAIELALQGRGEAVLSGGWIVTLGKRSGTAVLEARQRTNAREEG
jgi:tRNA(Ile)-lysidine synthase